MGQGGEDDLWRLRIAREAWRAPTPPIAPGGSPAFVGQVVAPYPMAGTFTMVKPVTVLGTEAEGGAPSYAAADPAARVAVYLLGPSAPTTGDYLVCRFVDYRWVAERMNGTGGGAEGDTTTLLGCFCSPVPITLAMVSTPNPDAGSVFNSCTILYGPTPPEYAGLHIGTNSFLSVESFPDPDAGGALFRYFLACNDNTWNLTRVYAVSPFGSPFRDGLLYQWVTNGITNYCDPPPDPSLHLHAGTAFAGAGAVVVTIDGGP